MTHEPPLILVSACLLGVRCRYDGESTPAPRLRDLAALGRVVPICPEVAGGLPTPRTQAEIEAAETGLDGNAVLRGETRVVTIDGVDVTAQLVSGAQAALDLATRLGIRQAILKSRSPSCGSGQIHNGRFESQMVPGDGVTVAKLKQAGMQVVTEEELGGLV